MPGKRITGKQVEIYMQSRKIGNTQVLAAAKAGFSERSGRDIEHHKIRNKNERRSWKTRRDPFAEVWENEAIPLLKQGVFEATFLLNELQRRYPDKFQNSLLRTLQRRVKIWRALCGPAKEVMFLQTYRPGELGVSDFTHLKNVVVTINGEPLEHILYHFRLPFSGFNYMQVFRGSGEPFTAFAQGLQEALQYLGGVPEKHRTDSLSASFKNLNQAAQEDLTARYRAFAEHYNMEPARINPGEGHENGTIEASHRHVKNRIEQELILRGNLDFDSFESYQSFIQGVVQRHNQLVSKKLELERAALRPLPATKAIEYSEQVAVVSSTSTVEIRQVTYTVPSRLIGERLQVRVYHENLECYLGSLHAITLARVIAPAGGKRRARSINYRDVIDSLVRKPGAFYSSRLRDDLLPNDNYRYIWEYTKRTMSRQNACKFIVGLLHLAAKHNCEAELAQEVLALIEGAQQLELHNLQNKFNPHKLAVPTVSVLQHPLAAYNKLIPDFRGALT